MGRTEGEAASAPESRAPGQGTVRTQDWGRQEEPLLESWVTEAQLTQWQRTAPRSGDNEVSETQPHPNVTPEAKRDPQGSPAPGEMALALVFCPAAPRAVGRPGRGRTTSPGSSRNQSLWSLPGRVSSKEGEKQQLIQPRDNEERGHSSCSLTLTIVQAILATHKWEFESRKGRAWPQGHTGSLG